MAGKRLNRERLVRIANLFSSPVAGERAAAASAFLRALEAGGMSPEDLLLGEAGPASKPEPKAKARAKPEAKAQAQQGAPDHIITASSLLERAASILTPFEQSFLRGVADYSHISEKQERVFRQIVDKVRANGFSL